MKLVGGFEEHFPGGIGLFQTVADLRPGLAFENLSDRDARMAVGRRTVARAIGDFHGGRRPALQGEVREVVLEDLFVVDFCALPSWARRAPTLPMRIYSDGS